MRRAPIHRSAERRGAGRLVRGTAGAAAAAAVLGGCSLVLGIEELPVSTGGAGGARSSTSSTTASTSSSTTSGNETSSGATTGASSGTGCEPCEPCSTCDTTGSPPTCAFVPAGSMDPSCTGDPPKACDGSGRPRSVLPARRPRIAPPNLLYGVCKYATGTPCKGDLECATGKCKAGVCGDCDNDCAGGTACVVAGAQHICKSPPGAYCGLDSQCNSNVCGPTKKCD
ncbi:MAG: hypothetical protein U0414_43075 [Polyangiaceae bacterium]